MARATFASKFNFPFQGKMYPLEYYLFRMPGETVLVVKFPEKDQIKKYGDMFCFIQRTNDSAMLTAVKGFDGDPFIQELSTSIRAVIDKETEGD